jgi:hypothetical protein
VGLWERERERRDVERRIEEREVGFWERERERERERRDVERKVDW